MKRRIAILGLSGVGKSTLIGKIRETVPLLHLQASALIKAEQAHRKKSPDSSEALRIGAVMDNQSLMIAAYRREAAATDLPIVFDGHSIVDGRDGPIEIPASIFAALELDAIFYMSAEPHLIAERRRADVSRERPHRDIPTLEQHQHLAEATARLIADAIGCPFILIAHGNLGSVMGFISQSEDEAVW